MELYRVCWTEEDGELKCTVPLEDKTAVVSIWKDVERYLSPVVGELWVEVAQVEWNRIGG